MSENSYPPPPASDPQSPYPGYGTARAYPQQQSSAGYTPYPAPPKTNTLAIVSLVSGIAAFVVLPLIASIVAVITGHMALKQLKTNGESGRGLALAGTIIGWVGIGFAVLGVILLIVVIGLVSAGGAYTYNS